LRACRPAPPLEGRHPSADDRAAGPGGRGERLVHPGDQIVVGSRVVAHEHQRRDVQRQLLDRRVEQEARIVGSPVVADHLGGHPVDVLDIAGQPGAGERLLHDPAVVHVLVEIEQHQATVEERADERVPTLLREVFVPVGEDGLGRVGSQCDDRGHRRRVRVVDRTVCPVNVQQVVGAAAEGFSHVAANRQTGVAHDGLEAAARRRFGQCVLRPLPFPQPLLDHTHPGNRVQRRGQPTVRLIQQVMRGADRGHRCSSARAGSRRGSACNQYHSYRHHHRLT